MLIACSFSPCLGFHWEAFKNTVFKIEDNVKFKYGGKVRSKPLKKSLKVIKFQKNCDQSLKRGNWLLKMQKKKIVRFVTGRSKLAINRPKCQKCLVALATGGIFATGCRHFYWRHCRRKKCVLIFWYFFVFFIVSSIFLFFYFLPTPS